MGESVSQSVSQSGFKCTVCMLTYKTHLDKEKFRQWFKDVCEPGWCAVNEVKIAIAHETGKEGEYDHSHVLIHWAKAHTISLARNPRKYDYEGIHPNLKKMTGGKAWVDGLKYISKEDKDVGYEVEPSWEDTVQAIWDCKDEKEVICMCGNATNVFPYLQIFKFKAQTLRHQEYNESLSKLELNEYQKQWWNRLKDQNDRKVLWIADYEGGKGKSTFGKWLRITHLAEKMVCSSKDINFMYKGSEYVYLDLARTQCEYRSIYQSIEELKNGDMVSGKYEGRSVLYAPPKIVIFSNFYPDRSGLSGDRWDIVEHGARPDESDSIARGSVGFQ